MKKDECYKLTHTENGEILFFKKLKNIQEFLGCSHSLLMVVLNPLCRYNHTAKGYIVERVKIENQRLEDAKK